MQCPTQAERGHFQIPCCAVPAFCLPDHNAPQGLVLEGKTDLLRHGWLEEEEVLHFNSSAVAEGGEHSPALQTGVEMVSCRYVLDELVIRWDEAPPSAVLCRSEPGAAKPAGAEDLAPEGSQMDPGEGTAGSRHGHCLHLETGVQNLLGKQIIPG
ncbi:hypothetical protein AV530_006510 [Patagioenas fasciata monilis]|uniref:Uncharacterized protein n=1 Tax=Patagioenas fasciata monilis TaxID=372326 RepID=A0A1V4KIH4_PATFA|nr:hypothetical protein AV530_006510 [Patagioenas fasciata monilis]